MKHVYFSAQKHPLKTLFFIFAGIYCLAFSFNTSAQDFNVVLESTLPNAHYGYGNKVSIHKNYAIVGSLTEDNNNPTSLNPNSKGAAYMYEKNTSGLWKQTQRLTAPIRSFGELFGTYVTIHGNYALVSGYGYYIFQRNSSGIWEEKQHVLSDEGDTFNTSFAISDSTVYIGGTSPIKNKQGNDSAISVIHIFKRTTNGNWNEAQKLNAPSNQLSISNNYMIAGGAPGTYMYEKDAEGQWIQKQQLIASSLVSISNTYAILSNGTQVYLYERNDAGVWVQKQFPAISLLSLSISIDGDIIVIGNYSERIQEIYEQASGKPTLWDNAGAMDIIKRSESGEWVYTQRIVESPRQPYNYFGYSAVISEGSIMIGSFIGLTPIRIFAQKNDVVTASMNTTFSEYAIQAVPNPTNDVILLQSEHTFKDAEISLRSITGSTLFRYQHISGNQQTIDMSAQASGIYLLEITENNSVSRIKVIKN